MKKALDCSNQRVFACLCSGQTLIESIVSLGVVCLLISGLVVAALSSLKFAQNSKHRSTATAYARQSIELARRYRDSNWNNFSQLDKGQGTTYCGLANNGSFTIDPCPVTKDGSEYIPTVTFTYDEGSQTMTVVAQATWREGSYDRNITLTTVLTKWK